jgi:hypothetical protein
VTFNRKPNVSERKAVINQAGIQVSPYLTRVSSLLGMPDQTMVLNPVRMQSAFPLTVDGDNAFQDIRPESPQDDPAVDTGRQPPTPSTIIEDKATDTDLSVTGKTDLENVPVVHPSLLQNAGLQATTITGQCEAVEDHQASIPLETGSLEIVGLADGPPVGTPNINAISQDHSVIAPLIQPPPRPEMPEKSKPVSSIQPEIPLEEDILSIGPVEQISLDVPGISKERRAFPDLECRSEEVLSTPTVERSQNVIKKNPAVRKQSPTLSSENIGKVAVKSELTPSDRDFHYVKPKPTPANSTLAGEMSEGAEATPDRMASHMRSAVGQATAYNQRPFIISGNMDNVPKLLTSEMTLSVGAESHPLKPRHSNSSEEQPSDSHGVSTPLNAQFLETFNRYQPVTGDRVEQLEKIVSQLETRIADHTTRLHQAITQSQAPSRPLIIIKQPTGLSSAQRVYWHRIHVGRFHLRTRR